MQLDTCNCNLQFANSSLFPLQSLTNPKFQSSYRSLILIVYLIYLLVMTAQL